MAVNDVILASKYNSIQSKVSGVLSNYGQSGSSGQVSRGARITETQWDNLRSDLTKVYRHIHGISPSITDITGAKTMAIRWAHAVEYDLIADDSVTNQYTAYTGGTTGGYTQQMAIAGQKRTNFGTGWNTYKDQTYTIQWASSSAASQFFNSGGVINVLSGWKSVIGLTTNSNDTGWANLADAMNNIISITRTDYVANGSATSGKVFDATTPYTANYATIKLTWVDARTYTFYAEYRDIKTGSGITPNDEPLNIDIYTGVNFLNCQGGEFDAPLPTVS